MEYRAMEEGVSFEIVCNPNAHATAFQARYLITINHEKIRVASEGQLSALKSDVDNYVEARNWWMLEAFFALGLNVFSKLLSW
jgi:hypothetical protein